MPEKDNKVLAKAAIFGSLPYKGKIYYLVVTSGGSYAPRDILQLIAHNKE
jgi:hypothetical protein